MSADSVLLQTAPFVRTKGSGTGGNELAKDSSEEKQLSEVNESY